MKGRKSRLIAAAATAVALVTLAACSSNSSPGTSSAAGGGSSAAPPASASSSSGSAASGSSAASASSSAGSSAASASSQPSGSSRASASGGSTAPVSAAQPSLAPQTGKSLTVLTQWTGTEGAAFNAVVAEFNKETGAKVVAQAAGGNYATVLGTKVSGGTPPGIAIVSLPSQIAQFAGQLAPLNTAATAAVNANYASTWASLGSYNGKVYGVPVDASDKSTVWYNANLFSQAGISSTPTTWDQFIQDGQQLNQAGITVPISVGGGDGWTLTDWFENVYIRTAGISNYDKLTKHQIPWTDSTVTTALNDLKQIWGDTSLIGDPADALKVGFTQSVDNVFKAKPTSAIVYEASFVATTISSDKDPAKVGTDAKFFDFPSINGSAPVMEAAGDFAIAFDHTDVAQEFLTFLSSPLAAKLLVSYPGSGFLSPNKNLDTSAYPDATSKQLGQALISVGDNFRFDMSDQSPAAFGGTAGSGEWLDLQNFLKTGDVQAAQTALEADANKVKWS